MLTEFIPFLALITGAFLQYFFTRHIENKRHIRGLRSKAYMDYLKCVVDLAQFMPQPKSKESIEIFARTGDSKARICLYGSNEAIKAFSVFEERGARMETSDQRQAFIDMVAIMRIDSGSKVNSDPDDIQNILLGFKE